MAVNRYYNRFRRFCAVLIGCVFVLSGSFKLMDPVGSSLVVGEYWNFFHLGFMRWSSMPVGVMLALLETLTGIALMSGVYRRLTAVVTSAMCLFFTLITVILAVFNPVMDCGCFGEVVHLTHLQSLVKNLILLTLCCMAFLPFRDFGNPGRLAPISAALATLSSLILLLWSCFSLPFKDYTDLRIGTRLEASLDESESAYFAGRFVYSKDGVERSFTLDEDLPDSTWTFERIDEGEPHERTAILGVRDPRTGAYVDTLAAGPNVLVISTYRKTALKPAARQLMSDFEAAGGTALHLGVDVPAADCPDGGDVSGAEFSAADYLGDGSGGVSRATDYLGDRRSLMSLNRSNGGATLIQDGIVVRKWAASRLPSMETLGELMQGEAEDNATDTISRSNTIQQAYLLWIFAVLMLL